MMFKNLLPHPIMSLLLLILWLALVNHFSLGQVLLGLLLGILIPRMTRHFWPETPQVKKPLLLMRFLLTLFWDIISANFSVARRILRSPQRLNPAFIRYPLSLTDDFAITLLASAISLTPGTVTADLSSNRQYLLIHALDASDQAQLVASIHQRYEVPLKEIFAC